jgi:DNA-directed RNA polymerase subunit RPC12/RpoP
MIYKDYAREYEKYKLLKEEEMQARKQKLEEEKETMVNCPYCNKKIPAKLKVCLYCHGKILSPMEMLMVKIFSTRNMIVAVIILVLIGVGVVLMMYPQLVRK